MSKATKTVTMTDTVDDSWTMAGEELDAKLGCVARAVDAHNEHLKEEREGLPPPLPAFRQFVGYRKWREGDAMNGRQRPDETLMGLGGTLREHREGRQPLRAVFDETLRRGSTVEMPARQADQLVTKGLAKEAS